jgi:hypothetical protein
MAGELIHVKKFVRFAGRITRARAIDSALMLKSARDKRISRRILIDQSICQASRSVAFITQKVKKELTE